MQPFQWNLLSAAKDNSITHAAVAPRNLDAATTMRYADTALQNTIQLRTAAQDITAPLSRQETPNSVGGQKETRLVVVMMMTMTDR